ncbi:MULTISPECIES: hypothetical protein [unclassified Streptomyces]|uniref:hypothetical protein n=1 Tax=unclassified Streptomyces TaxID=2593676 RepID=UPI0004C1A070|nr:MULTISPECIES: hypothetical protein [unclassified Streptomyces]
MGDHSKPKRFDLGAVVSWAKAHPKIVSAFVVGVVGVITAVKPEFPGAAIVSFVNAVLGA